MGLPKDNQGYLLDISRIDHSLLRNWESTFPRNEENIIV